MNDIENEQPQSGMMADVARVRAEAQEQVKTGKTAPTGDEDTYVAPEAKAEAAPELPAGAEPVVPAPAPELIRIGDKEFTSQAEAIKYAESLEYERLVNEAYTQGVRDSAQVHAPAQATAPEEDKFEERFYSDPKGTLRELKEAAKNEAIELMKREQKKEAIWSQFQAENPDIDRRDAERILNEPENWETIGRMADIPKAMKLLAQKTRNYYDGIIERRKPRTELSNRPAPVVGSGIGASGGVTPQKKDSAPQSMVAQLKTLRRS